MKSIALAALSAVLVVTGCSTTNVQKKVYSAGPGGVRTDNSAVTSKSRFVYASQVTQNNVINTNIAGEVYSDQSYVEHKGLGLPIITEVIGEIGNACRSVFGGISVEGHVNINQGPVIYAGPAPIGPQVITIQQPPPPPQVQIVTVPPPAYTPVPVYQGYHAPAFQRPAGTP